VRRSLRSNVAGLKMGFDQEAFIAESKEMRLKHLEEQAMFALKTSCENFENPVFPNAMIAGDCVITHLLGRLLPEERKVQDHGRRHVPLVR
jgi:phosphoadenosine phosphosulfate reductase